MMMSMEVQCHHQLHRGHEEEQGMVEVQLMSCGTDEAHEEHLHATTHSRIANVGYEDEGMSSSANRTTDDRLHP